MVNVIRAQDKSMIRNASFRRRRENGVSLVEFCAALVLGIPLVITILYVTLEASIYFAIKTNTDIAARNAARSLAIEIGRNGAVATEGNGGTVHQQVYTRNQIPRYVVNNAQFTSNFTAGPPAPATITVWCTYPSGGAYGLPGFPNPDPLNLGRGAAYNIISQATFATE